MILNGWHFHLMLEPTTGGKTNTIHELTQNKHEEEINSTLVLCDFVDRSICAAFSALNSWASSRFVVCSLLLWVHWSNDWLP